MFAQYQAEIMTKQEKQKLYFKATVNVLRVLPKGKRINLSVTFSLFPNRKHTEPTKANYQIHEQSSLLFSLRSSTGAHLSENQSLA